MVRLRGGTYYLVLYRSEDLKHRSIAIFDRFDRAVTPWRNGQRVSPIFSLDAASPIDLLRAREFWILFMGPCAPFHLDSNPSPYCFASLGLYNIVIFSDSQEQRRRSLALCSKLQVQWEEWSIHAGEVVSVDLAPFKARPGHKLKGAAGLPKKTPFLREPIQDYIATISSAIISASSRDEGFFDDYSRFDSIFREIINHLDLGENERNRLLALANAALSRHISLTFTGTSPVLENECHLWAHSLLGVGTASLAILRFRQFMENIWARARVSDRILALEAEDAVSGGGLESIDIMDPFWDRDHLFCYSSQQSVPSLGSSLELDFLPLVTCFSSRDGFRSTAVSLSAPLETIGSCNSIQWTLLTLTHEFSHIIVESLLGHLWPKVRKHREVAQVCEWWSTGNYPNLFLQLRSFLCFALWKFSGAAPEEDVDAHRLAEYINDFGPELSEVLTHCFDFQYFYRRNPEAYIRSAWATWSAIPFLRDRLYTYLVRCLCAIHTQNIARKTGRNISFETLLKNLRQARDAFSGDSYIDAAIKIAEKRRSDLLKDLGKRELAVKFARYFLFSETIDSLLTHESALSSSKRGGYVVKPLEFNGDPVESPLRFIGQFANDRSPDPVKALWILSQLAFQLGGV